MAAGWCYTALLLLVTHSTLISCRLIRPMYEDSCPVPIQQSVYNPAPCDCADIYIYCMEEEGKAPETGVYTVYYGDPLMPKQVYCDMESDGGGWTVFQRRFNGIVHFLRGWNAYVNGFGNPEGEYWLGLQYLHWLTNYKGAMELRIELIGDPENTGSNEIRSAIWSTFAIAGPEDDYSLTLSGYDSPDLLGDSIAYHNGRPFSTMDNDNDSADGNCAKNYGAWWHGACHQSNLNGLYLGGAHTSYANGMEWKMWNEINNELTFGLKYSYLSSTMAMRWGSRP